MTLKQQSNSVAYITDRLEIRIIHKKQTKHVVLFVISAHLIILKGFKVLLSTCLYSKMVNSFVEERHLNIK